MKAVASLAKELDIVLTFSDKVRVEDSWQGFSPIFHLVNNSASPWGYLKVFFFGGGEVLATNILSSEVGW